MRDEKIINQIIDYVKYKDTNVFDAILDISEQSGLDVEDIVKSLDENGIKWDTCPRFNYVDPTGKERTYTPDIFLPEYNVYLDPKNDFLISNKNPKLGFPDTQKIMLASQQNDIRIIILNSEQLSWDYIKTILADLPERSNGTV